MLRFNDFVRSLENYDLILVDTGGTITVGMFVLLSDLVISPLKSELLSACEFVRGTMRLYQQLQVFTKHGSKLPQLKAVINCLDKINDAKSVVESLRKLFTESNDAYMELFELVAILALLAYREVASLALPVHRHNKDEKENIRNRCTSLFPQCDLSYF